MVSATEFEDRVRATASILWNREAEKERIAGINLDCVLKIDSGRWTVIEVTKNHDLEKVRGDINRLSMTRASLFANSNIMADCYLVLFRSPTQAMVDAGKDLHIKVVSFQKFERQLFDFKSYAVERRKLQFGSAVNPLTGEPDNSEYVPVAYIKDSGIRIDIDAIAESIRDGKKVILIGEYGAGKSRCVRELFSMLSGDGDSTGYYYLAIDLRKAWGLQSASEILRRHLDDVGFSAYSDRVIKAHNAGRVCFLLDGFDELGSQAWSNNSLKLQNIRYETLAGVRELISKNKGGLLVCGRDHYFNGNVELFRSLGIKEKDAELIRCKDEFSEEEMENFLERVSVNVPVPDWLPKRPLMCQAIANLEGDDIINILEADNGDVKFWHTFMNVLCARESRIKSSLDPETIFLVLKELARMTRAKASGVGPLTLSEIQKAFESVLGREPVEGASVMLQRLPGLGRTEAESDDRKFIDIYIVDGLRALDVADMIISDDKGALRERWSNPLGILGQRVLAERIGENPSVAACIRYANHALNGGNAIIASDIVGSMHHCGLNKIDFNGLTITDGHFSQLNLLTTEPRRLAISDSIIDSIVFPSKPISDITVKRCLVSKAIGISGKSGLPSWVTETEVSEYDSVVNVSGIKNVRLTVQHRILVTVLKKTFFQKGSGRQEEALLRGLGQIDRKGYTPRILSYLVSNGILEEGKGDHGKIYVPVIKHKKRVGTMLAELNMSTDEIWEFAASL